MKSISLKLYLSFISFVALLAPISVFASNLLALPNLIVCGQNGPDCTFADLFRLGEAIIQFLFYLSIPLTVVGFTYVGYLFMTAGGNSDKVTDAKKIFGGVLKGFLFMLGAWLIVHTIVSPLLNTANGYKEFGF